jgi:hypothetical protein
VRYSFLSNNTFISPQVTLSLNEVQKESEKQVMCRCFLALQIIANKLFKIMANLKYIGKVVTK